MFKKLSGKHRGQTLHQGDHYSEMKNTIKEVYQGFYLLSERDGFFFIYTNEFGFFSLSNMEVTKYTSF